VVPEEYPDRGLPCRNMTRADFTEEIARVLETTRKDAKILLEIILDSMVRALRKGERVELRGFGSFSTHVRAGRRR